MTDVLVCAQLDSYEGSLARRREATREMIEKAVSSLDRERVGLPSRGDRAS